MFGEQTSVYVGELFDDRQRFTVSQAAIHHVESCIQIFRQVAAIGFRKLTDRSGEQVFFKNTSVFGKETEQQTGNKDIQVVQVGFAVEFVIGT